MNASHVPCHLMCHLSKPHPSLTFLPCIQLYIGRHGSCAAVGVVALGDIAEGECLALIPRAALLNCSNSRVHKVVKRDKVFQTQLPELSSWVPLLIALLAEYSQKVHNEGINPSVIFSL